jgi:glucose-1-phosphate thymidylyltransferase
MAYNNPSMSEGRSVGIVGIEKFMPENALKVVIPMAGMGSRLRPHTWSKPKQLISLADSTVMGHVLNILKTLPPALEFEFINIIGAMGDQLEAYFCEKFPDHPKHFVIQANPKGQSHAIAMARDYLHGPMLMIFSDTLIETDLSFLGSEVADIVAWVTPVPDPRSFGVAQVDADGKVIKIIEKPDNIRNNLAVIGCYFFKRSEDLLSAIDEQIRRNIQFKGEFFLADAINVMLERGARARVQLADVWLDAGTPETILMANRYLLEHGHANSESYPAFEGVTIVPPVYLGPNVEISESVIGPFASLGAGCKIERSMIRDSIIEPRAQVRGVILDKSMVGRQALVNGQPNIVNIGDNSAITV